MKQCKKCEKNYELRICSECGTKAGILDCGHVQQPTFISASESGDAICDNCAEKIVLDKKRTKQYNEFLDEMEIG